LLFNLFKDRAKLLIITAAKLIVITFGIFIILAGFLMLFNPEKARELLKKFASNNVINYTEITLRLMVGIARTSGGDF